MSADRDQLSSLVDVRIELTREFAGPVQLVRLLNERGLGLTEAHAPVGELANMHVVTVRLWDDDLGRTIERIGALGLVADGLHETGSAF